MFSVCLFWCLTFLCTDIKNSISRFFGFVWHDDEEKQMWKLKEKLDKCIKEKLVEVCDVLDISISKSTTKKSQERMESTYEKGETVNVVTTRSENEMSDQGESEKERASEDKSDEDKEI
ncbi:DNA ligase 1-like isoform X1 [Olea europaea subsp. europaea]|uniref:DNA ligase 1-like isoform X1 n=1 Tax=Olea europaea subsp. europaea TaxID=158383 RepID=A0A8S0RRB6_OLEEU|nr:DNA ligase 1-like isoform X1 [Olea europaea subsp. europaea]